MIILSKSLDNSISLIDRPKQILPFRVKVDFRIMVIKGYSTFPKIEDWSLTIVCSLVSNSHQCRKWRHFKHFNPLSIILIYGLIYYLKVTYFIRDNCYSCRLWLHRGKVDRCGKLNRIKEKTITYKARKHARY